MKHSVKLLASLAVIALVGCTNGGGDGDGDGGGELPGFNSACSAIGLNERIINGSQCVSETNSPVVRILISVGGRQALCSGTMITSRYVLTAAHCFSERPTSAAVLIGNDPTAVTRVAVHPQFRRGETSFGVQAGFNDVAILELASEVNVPTLPILISRDVNAGDSLAIYGYGLDENSELGTLRGGTAPIDEVTRDHITTKFDGSGSNTCEGDSGGPAAVNTAQGLAIVGLTSSGTVETCTPGDLSIYANVQSPDIINFIQDNAPGARII